jgi:hypothetical protein
MIRIGTTGSYEKTEDNDPPICKKKKEERRWRAAKERKVKIGGGTERLRKRAQGGNFHKKKP